jgi:hypothetical protein
VPQIVLVGAGGETCYLPGHARLAAQRSALPYVDPTPGVTAATGLPLRQLLVIRSGNGAVGQLIWLFGSAGSCSASAARTVQVSEQRVAAPPSGAILSEYECDLTLATAVPRAPHLWLSITSNMKDAAMLHRVAQRIGSGGA